MSVTHKQKRFNAEIRSAADKTRAEVERECRVKGESTVKELDEVRKELEKAKDATRDSEVRNAPADIYARLVQCGLVFFLLLFHLFG